MLHALMDGRALTATELAHVARITPQTASGHLARLLGAGLVSVERQGRHRYHRLASAAVAQMIESIMQVAADTAAMRRPLVTGPRDLALRQARTCYDHIAGELGVALADALVANRFVELSHEAGVITECGVAFLEQLGIDIEAFTDAQRRARILCRPCLDWSERRPHLAGAVGAALCALSLRSNWVRRIEGTRALRITREGHRVYRNVIGVRMRG